MRKLSIVVLLGLVTMLALPAEAVIEEADAGLKCTPGETCTTDLIAGQHINVGTVDVVRNGLEVTVVFTIDSPDPWCLTETHLYIDTVAPKKSAPGQLGHTHENLGCVGTDSYSFTFAADPGCLYIAAHAVVQMLVGYEFDTVDFELELPDQVTMQVKYPYSGGPSYFETTVSGGTVLDGVYDGWCVDVGHTINQSTEYTANVYSSLESLVGVVDHPENIDLVNWIINQGFVGQASVCGGDYTYGDVQRAIWELIDDQLSTSGLNAWLQCRVDEIKAAASPAGEGYTPECGGVVAVVLVPVGSQQITIAQVTLIERPDSQWCTPVYESETAWGFGTKFPKSWAMYFGCFCDQ